MKLTEREIDSIVDDVSQYIYADIWIWNEFSIEWVQDYLSNYTNSEYDNEDLNEILERLQSIQEEKQEESISEEKETLYQEINNFIEDMDDIHLSPTDIGKILVKLANSYLDE